MITESEKEEIISTVIERIYLRLPEIIGNLISNHAAKIRMNKQFYDKYPEFKDYRTIVAGIIEDVEGDDPTKSFDEIIKLAVPKIKSQLKNLKNLDMKKVNKPNLDFGSGEI